MKLETKIRKKPLTQKLVKIALKRIEKVIIDDETVLDGYLESFNQYGEKLIMGIASRQNKKEQKITFLHELARIVYGELKGAINY